MSADEGPRCPWRPDQPCPWHPVGRDAEIIRLVALGWTDHAIGKALGLNTFTVGHTVLRLCKMLGLGAPVVGGSSGRRVQLAAWAGRHGLTVPAQDTFNCP